MARRRKNTTPEATEEVVAPVVTPKKEATDVATSIEEVKVEEPVSKTEPEPKKEAVKAEKKKAALPKAKLELVRGKKYTCESEECVFVEMKGEKAVVRFSNPLRYKKVLASALS
jgi:outer membrane biosynthesis protein TonB